MSGTGEVTADFAGEARDFRIRLGEIRLIEAKCGSGQNPTGIGEVCRRLARANYMLDRTRDQAGNLDLLAALAGGVEIFAEDVRAPIYHGLIGKGMPPAVATALVRQEIDERGMRGLLDNAAVALVVLLGSQEVPPGESQAGDNPATPESPSTSSGSTASGKRSASRRARSTS